MQKILQHAIWDTHALLLARVLMGALFVLAGIQKFQGIEGTAGYIGSVGLPMPVVLAWAAAILEVCAGALIVAGKYFKEAALALAVFTLVVAFIFHNPSGWTPENMQQVMFMKDMAIAAGLLYMASHGTGKSWALKGK